MAGGYQPKPAPGGLGAPPTVRGGGQQDSVLTEDRVRQIIREELIRFAAVQRGQQRNEARYYR